MTYRDTDTVSLYEFEFYCDCLIKKNENEDFKMHKQAWLSHVVTSKKQIGNTTRSVYDRFSKFYQPNKKATDEQVNLVKKLREFKKKKGAIDG